MCHHPILWGLLAGFVITRIVYRLRWLRRGGGLGRRCGHHGRHGAWRRDRRSHGASLLSVTERVARLARDLELNARQNDEVQEVFAMIRETLGARFEEWGDLDLALAAIAVEPFDRARAEAAFGAVSDPARKKELVDGIEHIHNILTPEQRARLQR